MAFLTLQRSFEILELKQTASLDDAHRAYKDLVNVWHPDRFAANPRLKEKAERRLQEVNVAYETVKSFLQQGSLFNNVPKETTESSAQKESDGDISQRGGQRVKTRSRTEMAAEAGTMLILSFFSYISEKLHPFKEKDPR